MTDGQGLHYSMIIEWEPKGQVFVVTVPELPGCRTHGETYEQAVQQGREVIEGWIDAMRHWGHPIPPPRYYFIDQAEAAVEEEVGVS